MDGYICLYRKMLDWEWMQEPLTAHLFTCMLLMANQEEGWRYKGVALHAGQFVTSLAKLAKRSGLSVKEVRKRLERLQESGELEVVCDSTRNTTITICNYGFYQYVGDNSEGTISGAKKSSVKGSKCASNKSTTSNKGTEKGIIMGTISGTVTEKQQKTEKKGTISGIVLGTISGKEKGTISKAVNNTTTKGYKGQGQKEGTILGTITGKEKGTNSGNNQYIYIDNNIDNIKDNIDNIKDNIENTEKKKKEKESENAKNAAPTIKELEEMFEAFRKAYKGTKRGFKVEFDNFKKKRQSDWKEIVPKLMPALENMEAWRKEQQQAGQFVPPYAMLQTWLNQQRWTTEYEASNGNGEAAGGNTPESGGTAGGYVPNYDEEF